jgi:DNA polymerase-3 subunit alpha
VEAREVKASEEAVPVLAELDWLEAHLIPDREALLAAGRPAEGGFRQKGEDEGPVVPF